jgi:hypothetical protein
LYFSEHALKHAEIHPRSDGFHQLNDLSKRMSAMNTVYGNMLNAMNIKD